MRIENSAKEIEEGCPEFLFENERQQAPVSVYRFSSSGLRACFYKRIFLLAAINHDRDGRSRQNQKSQ